MTVIIFEGADGTGKSTIAKELAKDLGYVYFSDTRPSELDWFKPSTITAHLKALEFGYALLHKLDANIVLDRGHGSEYAYGQVLRGASPEDFIKIDTFANEIKAKIVVCYKTNDFRRPDEKLKSTEQEEVQQKFIEFSKNFTTCENLLLNTTDENLQKQIASIIDFLFPTPYELDKTYNNKFMNKYVDYPKNLYRRTAEVFTKAFYDMYTPKSVIDVGCATGYWLKEYEKLGVESLLGIDGSTFAQAHFMLKPEQFKLHDLRTPLNFKAKADLVESLEVAEHIEERFAEAYVKTLTELAKDTIIITAANFGQRGDMHVNMKPKEYWENLFKKYGFKRSTRHENAIKNAVKYYKTGIDIVSFMPKNIIIFKRILGGSDYV